MRSSKLASFIKPNFFEIINCVSNSNEEPFAMSKKCEKSLLIFLPAPSAIFDGIETEHLLI